MCCASSRRRSTFPPLGLLTVAALLPPEWDLKLVDMNVRALTDEDLRWPDYVMVSAMIVHKAAVSEVMERLPGVSPSPLSPEARSSHRAGMPFPTSSIFVVGEAEDLMPQLVEDLRSGTLKAAV